MREEKTSVELRQEGKGLVADSDTLKALSKELIYKSHKWHQQGESRKEKALDDEKKTRHVESVEENNIKKFLIENRKQNKNNKMNKLLIFIAFFLFFSFNTMAQMPTELTWKQLMNVQFEEDEMGENVPIFSKELQSYNFQTVMVEGFMIPVDVDGDYYVLSAFPYSSCFFCGNAGPESIVELRLAQKGQRFQMDDARKFKGMLVLSQTPNGLIYVLEDAELVQ